MSMKCSLCCFSNPVLLLVAMYAVYSSMPLIIALFCVFHCRRIPHFGPSLQAPFKEYLSAQKAKLHHKQGVGQASVSHSLFTVAY